MIRFAHMADCHLGSWNAHPELRELPLRAFEKAISRCIDSSVDFIIIAGDLFDTSMPGVDVLRFAAEQLRRCKDAGLAVYVVAGSHDFSPTGKTMLSVLESAGLLVNVNQKLIEHKIRHLEDSLRESSIINSKLSKESSHNMSGQLKESHCDSHIIQIFGIEGLRGGLDKKTFETLQLPVLDKNAFRIFVFHAAIEGHCPPQMESLPVEILPSGFAYYATGHLHELIDENMDGKRVVFPGPLFPTSFPELEKFQTTGFYIIDVDKQHKIGLSWQELSICESTIIEVDGDAKTPSQIENEFLDKLEGADIHDKIVLLKTKGKLASGRQTDLNFKAIAERCANQGALTMKKSVHLVAEELELKTDASGMGVKEMENAIVEKAIADNPGSIDKEFVAKLMDMLKEERRDDEKTAVYEDRIKSGVLKVLNI